jgi:hypothetical protein
LSTTSACFASGTMPAATAVPESETNNAMSDSPNDGLGRSMAHLS